MRRLLAVLLLFPGIINLNACLKFDCAEADSICNPLSAWLLYNMNNDMNDVSPIMSPIPDSGQLGCWDSAGVSRPCSDTGEDGNYVDVPNVWSLSVTDGGDTITDATSGLVWQRCSKGQSDTACSTGTASNAETQASADAYCAGLGLAGRVWRLPSIHELLLLPDYNYTEPAADDNDASNFYPEQPGGGVSAAYWTTTPDVSILGDFWRADMQYGTSLGAAPATGSYARCVSGPTMSAASFVDNGNGTVFDATTNLLWTKCSMGGTTGVGVPLDLSGSCTLPDGTARKTWENALSQCESLDYAGRTDWRLPNVREFGTIVKYTDASPSIDGLLFPNTSDATPYWASSSGVNSPSTAWSKYFSSGTMSLFNKVTTFNTRCVATGQ